MAISALNDDSVIKFDVNTTASTSTTTSVGSSAISTPNTNIGHWPTLHRMRPQFLARIAHFIVFGDTGSEVLLVTRDDIVYGLGSNQYGCLGIGAYNEATEPAEIVELRNKQITKLVYGSRHVLALTSGGEIFSWGDNSYGQLGNMNTFECLRPTLVGKHILAIQCGAHHTLALTTSGQVFSWGRNNYGQTGTGNNTNQLIPTKINALEPHYVVAIACGGAHSLALTSRGVVFGWGNNSHGQLGIGNTSHQVTPVQIVFQDRSAQAAQVKAMAAGANHTLLLLESGEVFAFGRNELGQLGTANVSAADSTCLPIKISVNERFRAISAHFASNLSVALSQSGNCYVWGELATEEQAVNTPRETPIRNIQSAFAIYSRRRNTPPPLMSSSMYEEDGLIGRDKAINRVIENLAKSFNDPTSSDLYFIVDGKEIHVHRWFLKISSNYFERMLSDVWGGEQRKEIEIHDYSYPIFYAYLKYIYTDCIEATLDEAIELLDLANCYLEDDLKSKCVNLIRNNLTIENCCQLYQIALQYQLTEFEKFIVNFVFNNVFEICRTSGFRMMSPDMCKELLITVSDLSSS